MTITGQAGNYFKFFIFKETPPDIMTKKEIVNMVLEAQISTGKKVKIKFSSKKLQNIFFNTDITPQPQLKFSQLKLF